MENTLFQCQEIMLLCTWEGSVCPLNERFLTVMIITHLFLALIVHSLLTVVIHWMEGVIWEGIEFLFWITSLFSALFPFPVGYREKVGAACGCRHVPAYGSNRRYWLLAFAAFLTASTSPLWGKDCVRVWWSHRWEPYTKLIIVGWLQGWLLWEAARNFPHVQ